MDQQRDLAGRFDVNGKSYAIYGGLNPVGRNKEAIVNIKSLGVSQHHAMFTIIDDDLHFITDLNSSNGTFLDGKKVDSYHLYKIKYGSRIKFGDIVGTYSKCNSLIPLSNDSQYSENFTQTFYRTDTQLMEESCLLNDSGNQRVPRQSPEDISTQEFVNVASLMEKQLHVEPTKLPSPQNLINSEDKVDLSKKCYSGIDQSVIDFHEAETQKVTYPDYMSCGSDFHEAKTQIVPRNNQLDNLNTKASVPDSAIGKPICQDQAFIDLHEAQTQLVIYDNVPIALETPNLPYGNELNVSLNVELGNNQETLDLTGSFNPVQSSTMNKGRNDLEQSTLQSTKQTEDISDSVSENPFIGKTLNQDPNIVNPSDTSCTLIRSEANDETLNVSQDSDIVKPVGISRNLMESQASVSVVSNVTQDSDVVIPLGISTNRIESQNSPNETPNVSQDTDHVNPLGKCKNVMDSQSVMYGTINMTLNDCEDEIHPVMNLRNIPEDVDDEENSNDSINFLTMQNVNDIENSDKIGKQYKNEECEKNPVRNEGPKSNEEEETNKKEKTKSDSSVTNSEDKSAEGNNVRKRKNKVKRKSKRVNVISDSESETDDEPQRKRKSPGKLESDLEKTKFDENSGSDTDIEKYMDSVIQDSGSDTDMEKDVTKLRPNNNSIASSVLSDSVLDDDDKVINESAVTDELIDNKMLKIQEKTNSKDTNKVFGIDESLNDSDFIPSTQEVCKTTKSMSQLSKSQNSEESFKLGLTQLMEDELGKNTSQTKTSSQTANVSEDENDTANNSNNNASNSENIDKSSKKFVFKKKSVLVKPVDITLDLPETSSSDEETADKPNMSKEDHVFLQPSQTISMKKRTSKEKNVPEDEIYMLSTQKFDGESEKSDVEDIYLQSTQKLPTEDDFVDPGQGTSKMGLTPVKQKFSEAEKNKTPENSSGSTVVVDEFEDMFATQNMNVNTTPSKRLEKELESLFASQRSVPTEESLDGIRSIILQKQIVDTKLPEKDSDLEAILQTQPIPVSPKTSETSDEGSPDEVNLGRSIETQLEVLFASQSSKLPRDKFDRPANPLANIFQDQPTQESQTVITKVNDIEIEEIAEKGESNVTETNEVSKGTKNVPKNGLEQSFVLLEAKSGKIKRSLRDSNCKEITVSCSKSRRSMAIEAVPESSASNILKEKSVRVSSSRKRKSSSSSEVSSFDVKLAKRESARQKNKSAGRSSDVSDDDTDRSVSSDASKSSRSTRTSRTVKLLEKIPEILDSDTDHENKVENDSSRKSFRNKKKIDYDILNSGVRTKETERVNFKNTPNSKIPRSKTSKKESNENDKNNFEKQNVTKHEAKDSGKSSPKKQITVDTVDVECVRKLSVRNSKKESNENDNNSEKESETKQVAKQGGKSNTKKQIMVDPGEVECVRKPSARHSKFESKKESNENDQNNSEKESETKHVAKDSGKSNSKKQITVDPFDVECVRKSSARNSKFESKKESKDKIDTPNVSPSRAKRKLKPRVVFTMMENPQMESTIKHLGGSIVDSAQTCTVLITQSVKRSMKLLSAVGLGKPICSGKWVQDSKKENEFSDPWDYILVDKEAESKWDFSLRTSLERSSQAKLFEGYTFQLLVTTALDVLKGAIESCGGKIVTRNPKGVDKFVIVGSQDTKDKCKKIIKQHPNSIIVEPEAIFDGVLRQEIRFERHLLK